MCISYCHLGLFGTWASKTFRSCFSDAYAPVVFRSMGIPVCFQVSSFSKRSRKLRVLVLGSARAVCKLDGPSASRGQLGVSLDAHSSMESPILESMPPITTEGTAY